MITRDFPQARERMVLDEVIGKGVTSPAVVQAMRAVPRHLFVEEGMSRQAYGGSALPIGWRQTISAPQMVAIMTEALEVQKGHKVLEIGTGSGYQTAVLAQLSSRIVSVERLPELATLAQGRLRQLGLDGVVVKVGDGSQGYPEAAPYDRILVTAAAPAVPEPLLRQLADGGVLVVPVGDLREQTLLRYRREGDQFHEDALCRCTFVPLLGQSGFSGDEG